MRKSTNRWVGTVLSRLLQIALMCALVPAQNNDYTFRTTSELVLVNVSVRVARGFVRDLKAEDFTVIEDNKPQKVLSFDLENTDVLATTEVAQARLLGAQQPQTSRPQIVSPDTTAAIKDRRLIILFFDISSMQPDEIDRSEAAAETYIEKQMAPADLVSVVSLGSSLRINQDFTTDRALLKKVLHSFNSAAGQGYSAGTTGTTEGTSDAGQPFTVDDTEYNAFNTDRRLEALRTIAASVAKVEQKKSLIYFSSGMDRTGTENQSQLRAAINAAVRANLAIYTMDIRGLQAMVPGGDAQNASLRGTSAYSGQSVTSQYDSNSSTQETLVTLAADTGGHAFLDSNDFSRVFKGVQDDTASYYILGYHSSNPARDGKYRHITVRLNRPGLKLEYRKGYYAPADFKHSTRDDLELQLQQELASELPSTDLPVYLSNGYFRIGENKFSVPISLIVPGSEIPFTRNSDRDKATLDVIGQVLDSNKRPVADVRDTVKLAIDASAAVQSKNVQYDSSVILIGGKYHLKFVVRENQTGRMGSFETDVTIPDYKTQPLKVSSVVLSSQIQPAPKKKNIDDPLIRDGSEIIPSVTHVFSSGQHLYFYYEVYDAALQGGPGKTKGGIRVLSNVAFFQGKAKAYETPVVETKEVAEPSRHAAVFQLDVPLSQLKPGFYTCQVNVVDDAAGHFVFPRLALLIRQ